ncbi:MAG TPA: lysophospholipid acyltransferase family protein, partial [Longimicrobiaceae bacterium]|nr:lysophospholipid acyltransferase family protein [Longimicrobiaceae bacterium]
KTAAGHQPAPTPDRASASASGLPPARSPRFFAFFARYLRRYLRRSFHRILLAEGSAPEASADRSTIVVLNHPSWHDPLLCGLLANELFPGRAHHAPIDAEALKRYPFLARLGLFGVDPTTRAGLRSFLRTTDAVLGQRGAMLWITAQGKFADVRERPLALMPGIAHAAARTSSVRVLPLALELAFWHERLPEALAAFGAEIEAPGSRDGVGAPVRDVEAWNRAITAALETTQDRLAGLSIERREEAFRVVLQGSRRTDAVFDAWRRLRGWITGRPYHSGHGDLVRRP